jgi:two-component system phosphate regulon sensor histidine kinase PhoR
MIPYDQILASLPHGVCVVDAAGKILFINPALERFLGWRSAEQIGQPLSRCLEDGIVDPALALCWTVALSEALAHNQTTFLNLSADFCLDTRDRPSVSLTGAVAPWQDERTNERGALLVFHDSAQHEDLQGIRHRFLSVVSHELGSPLTNISAATERVVKHLNGGNTEEWRLLQIIRSETARLRRMLGQFLAPTPIRPEPHRQVKSVTTLRPLLYRVAHTFQVRDLKHEIRVQVPPDLPFVSGDADQIQEILSNLVDNALRYSPPETEITLAAEAWSDNVVISVADRGGGLSAEDKKRVFEPLYRGSGKNRDISGLGVGLFVSRTLVQSLGGELWHEGLADGGTRFCFTVPRMQGLYLGDEEKALGCNDPDRRG